MLAQQVFQSQLIPGMFESTAHCTVCVSYFLENAPVSKMRRKDRSLALLHILNQNKDTRVHKLALSVLGIELDEYDESNVFRIVVSATLNGNVELVQTLLETWHILPRINDRCRLGEENSKWTALLISAPRSIIKLNRISEPDVAAASSNVSL